MTSADRSRSGTRAVNGAPLLDGSRLWASGVGSLSGSPEKALGSRIMADVPSTAKDSCAFGGTAPFGGQATAGTGARWSTSLTIDPPSDRASPTS